MTGLVMIAAGNVLGIAAIAGICKALNVALNAVDKIVCKPAIA